jgi:hypothetical protein
MNSLTHVGIMGKRGKDAARVVRGIYERDKCRMNLWSEPAVPSWDVWKKAGWGMEPAEDAHCNDIAAALIELLEDAESGVLISVTRKAEYTHHPTYCDAEETWEWISSLNPSK